MTLREEVEMLQRENKELLEKVKLLEEIRILTAKRDARLYKDLCEKGKKNEPA